MSYEWPTFEEAAQRVRKLGIKNCEEWKKYCASGKRPVDIPSNPQTTYKGKGWRGWRYWFGTERWSFKKARAFVRDLKLKSVYEWRQYRNGKGKSFNIPSAPALYYKEWISWNDWLGVTCHLKKQFRSFEEARKFAIKFNFKKQIEWFQHWSSNERPEDIPANPNQVYKNKGWTTWGDFLGTGNIHPGTKEFLPFEEARTFVRTIGLKKCGEWTTYIKSGLKPANIPSLPERIYAESGWLGYPDWVGKG